MAIQKRWRGAASASAIKTSRPWPQGFARVSKMSSPAKYARRRSGLPKKSQVSEMFQYSPLEDPTGQIRLLRIRRAFELSQKLSCKLRTHDRAAAPRYNAISYTWGDPTPTRAIYVNGYTLMVRQNCQYALGQARFHQVEDCLIWIDAICINQDDTDEKNDQVGIMGEIFEWAECVFACIGPIKGAACLFDLAEKLSNSRDCAQDDCPACSLFDPSCTNFDRDEFHVAHTWLESIDAARFKRVVDAFSRFCDNKYWERLWIIQEISLASTVSVVCGRSKIGWRSLTGVQELFNGIVYGTGRPVWSSHTLRSVILDKGIDCRTIDTCMDSQTNALSRLCECYWERQEMDLNNQLPTLGQWKCHDARDRIYSLRRLIRWPAACGPPVPDYSINTIDLAIDVTQRLGSSWVELVRVQWL